MSNYDDRDGGRDLVRRPYRAASTADYPSLATAGERRKLRSLLELTAGMVITAGLTACAGGVVQVGNTDDTDPVETPEIVAVIACQLQLPKDAARTVYWWDGYADYHIVIEGTGGACLVLGDNETTLLEAVDQLLTSHSVYDLDPSLDRAAIEAELLELVRSLAAELGVATDDRVDGVDLAIGNWESWEEIDGDMPWDSGH